MSDQIAQHEKLNAYRMFEEFLCAEAGATQYPKMDDGEDIAGVRLVVRRAFRHGMELGLDATVEDLEAIICGKGLAFRKMYRDSLRDPVAADLVKVALSCGQQLHEEGQDG